MAATLSQKWIRSFEFWKLEFVIRDRLIESWNWGALACFTCRLEEFSCGWNHGMLKSSSQQVKRTLNIKSTWYFPGCDFCVSVVSWHLYFVVSSIVGSMKTQGIKSKADKVTVWPGWSTSIYHFEDLLSCLTPALYSPRRMDSTIGP